MTKPRQRPSPSEPEAGSASADIKAPLSEQAYVATKQLILRMELKPGDYLNVAQLCERLSLGRSPVHAAIHRLGREGLLEILPRKGIIIRTETADSFVEIVSARLLIEPYLTGLAAERADATLIADLQALVKAGRKYEQSKDDEGGMRVDRLFHQRVYEGAGNKILADYATQLLDRSLRLWFLPALEVDTKRSNIGELEDLFQSIKARDKKAAVKKMEQHIGAIRRKFAPFTK